jgi:N-acetylneuraminic acid mutarotase
MTNLMKSIICFTKRKIDNDYFDNKIKTFRWNEEFIGHKRLKEGERDSRFRKHNPNL